MKCTICSFEIPEGKKCCPNCGRVITAADRKRAESTAAKTPTEPKTTVYRPAATRPTEPTQKTIHIPDIFSSDPNAPEYRDPHAYDRATADILEYDRQFVSRDRRDEPEKSVYSAPVYNRYEEPAANAPYENEYNVFGEELPQEDDSYEEPYPEEEPVRRSASRKNAKPHLNINIKMIIICIAVLIGLVIIVAGIHQIGKQFGFWGEKEPTSSQSEMKEPASQQTAANEPASAVPSASPTGKYTVTSDQKNIFMYKSADADRLFATIPNGTVIEITEISGEMGLTTYNSYTGWVSMKDLKYSPDATLDEKAGSPNEPATSDEPAAPAFSTGTYTVDLGGNGETLNLRSISSSSGDLLTTIPEGTELTVDDIEGSWGHVSYNGFDGWVFMEYLK